MFLLNVSFYGTFKCPHVCMILQGNILIQVLLALSIAQVADFGLAHASKDGSICFEPVNTDIRGTPGLKHPMRYISINFQKVSRY